MVALKTLPMAACMALMASAANAQAPQTEHNVSAAMAQAIIAGAIDQCTKDGYKVSVTIVDKAGLVAGFLRGDGTGPHTTEFSRMKAYTARTRGLTTLEFKAATATPETEAARLIPGLTIVGGGVPIKLGNEVIGAVGVSGAPGGEKDEVCAKAGLAKVADALK